MLKNLKAAQEMRKNMDPEDLKELMNQAKSQQAQMEDMIRKIVREEIEAQGLVRKSELE